MLLGSVLRRHLTPVTLLAGLIAMLQTAPLLITSGAHAAQPATDTWKPFRNIEMWDYCLTLPLDGYVEDFNKSDVKGKHVFVHRTVKAREIVVWGMDRAPDTRKLTPEQYYKQYFAGAEEQGLAFEARQLDVAARRFYSWGYWTNAYYTSRFVEIVWLRGDEVIKFRASFPVADAAPWKARLPALLQQTTVCKPGA